MRRLLQRLSLYGLACLVWLSVILSLYAAPQHAVVRIPSHGCSGTVISTGPGRSLVLSCAHAFQGRDRYRAISVDVPAIQSGPPVKVGVTLLQVDYRYDLALIEVRAGPFPHVLPVARYGHRPGRCLSIGYDSMRSHLTAANAVVLTSDIERTFTRENPRPGRSGGALMDLDSGVVIGVVQGYELAGERRGIYASHGAILRFLSTPETPGSPSRSVGGPNVWERRTPPGVTPYPPCGPIR